MHNPFLRRSVVLAVLVVTMVASGLAQAPPASTPVTLQFRALGDDGQPVLDLKAADVALKVNGKARELRSLELVQLASTPGAAPPAPFASNVATEPGRDVLVVFDDASIAPGKESPLRDAVGTVLDALSARDRVGLLSVRQGGQNIGLTGQLASVRTAIGGVVGGAPTTETSESFACRSRSALDTLKGLLRTPSDRPETIVFITASLSSSGREQPTARMGQSSELCLLTPNLFQEFAVAVNGSSANIYVAQIVDSGAAIKGSDSSTLDPQSMIAGLENLAGASGTPLLRLSGNVAGAIGRIMRETSALYVATFDVEASEQTGANYRIDLRVSRDRVKTYARPEIATSRADAKGASKAARSNPKDMLRVATVYRDLPIRAAGSSMRNTSGDEVKVVALFEPVDPANKIVSASVALFDEKSTLKKQWSSQDTDLARSPVMAALTAAPGKYRMRVATVDAAGRGGTADYELSAGLIVADPLKLSTLSLGAAAGGGLAPKLIFTNEAAAIGYLEIYGVPKGATVGVKFELSASEDGPAMGSGDATVRPGTTDDMRNAYGGFPLSALAPGDYVMRAIVSLEGKPVGRATRTLRKSP